MKGTKVKEYLHAILQLGLGLSKIPLVLLKGGMGKKGSRKMLLEQPFDFDMVCISHVVWSDVWQRNHHTMQRMAHNRRVLYCNPQTVSVNILSDIRSFTNAYHPEKHSPNLTVITPLVIRGERVFPFIKKINKVLLITAIEGKLKTMNKKNIVLWFYSPFYEYLAGSLDESLSVYDIQDEYSEYLGDHDEILARERKLLGKVDLVFTGTHALYETRKQFHSNIHFIPCGVDAAHFGKARMSFPPLPEDIKDIPSPILGYFGMVCGRIDTDLLEYLAVNHPEWSIVLIGNIVEKDFSLKKARPNIYLLGPKDYMDLPRYLQCFDACMVPFRLNKLTLKVNPTKILEYLAAGKPVVCTAIPDMQRFYSEVIFITESPEAFDAMVGKAFRAGRHKDDKRELRGIEMARENSWEGMVGKMERHMTRSMEQRYAGQ